uniref:Uncharacterized protein n=1 Tax=Phlegmariurus squarrosus TaxID=73615 RepID=H9M847_PHLSQ|nr:hypothetical protein HusqMp49 [Phlegmariurus squarrosus]AEV55754.1 hypothetical protein HusqMp49 [Phlegmariurus squarrosus]
MTIRNKIINWKKFIIMNSPSFFGIFLSEISRIPAAAKVCSSICIGIACIVDEAAIISEFNLAPFSSQLFPEKINQPRSSNLYVFLVFWPSANLSPVFFYHL